ncbi:FRG domain-containing protein [Burkholderia sp. Ax-1724]|uniref:FRG domain-containing protein n=1 Tax=Burkholderia sp. Ax-1724 TaxID=2608336 RepID=UPI00141DB164|nr:FRG domain-containing protein [Burkholderia sp. Ax-1724]NIF56260.1 FRG domain-containing protein [Burkholderia sp. Ax-1724]
MSVTIEKRTTQGFGEARDLATFLNLVDRWTQGIPDLGYTISLFRGQEDESWLLKPGIARKQYAKRVRPDTEQRMLNEFKQRGIPHLESTVELADADWLAIAQHHAMPTRLLDWTGSALAALWFAIKRPAVEGNDGELKAAAVWMLAATDADMIKPGERANPLEITQTKLLKPRHVSRRIAAQDGWFSVHRGIKDGLDMKYVSLDTNKDYKKRLSYIRVPPEAFGSLRGQLQTAGINRGVLFPDLDGVAGRIADAILYPDDQVPLGAGNLGRA